MEDERTIGINPAQGQEVDLPQGFEERMRQLLEDLYTADQGQASPENPITSLPANDPQPINIRDLISHSTRLAKEAKQKRGLPTPLEQGSLAIMPTSETEQANAFTLLQPGEPTEIRPSIEPHNTSETNNILKFTPRTRKTRSKHHVTPDFTGQS